jgi:hypothetical protein
MLPASSARYRVSVVNREDLLFLPLYLTMSYIDFLLCKREHLWAGV